MPAGADEAGAATPAAGSSRAGEAVPAAPPAPPTTPAALAGLHPAYFALVMATGIVSLAAHFTGHPLIARGLLGLNIGAYIALWALYVARLVRYPRAVVADFGDHGRGVGYFTIVAATCVLGSQFVEIAGAHRLALGLWIAGIALWALLIYGVFTLLTVRAEKPPLVRGINGGWLVAVVATQSVSILGTQLAAGFEAAREPTLFFSLVMWLGGGMLYVWIIGLIFYRYTFFPMSPADLAPPYWINMGAVAISTLAGALLVLASPSMPLLMELRPFTKGVTLLFWATATSWIPMLLTLGFWRHVACRFPLRYDPLYWGAVFPLGMYTVCTYRLAAAIEAPFIGIIPRSFVYIAMAAWLLTFLGLLTTLSSAARRRFPGAGRGPGEG